MHHQLWQTELSWFPENTHFDGRFAENKSSWNYLNLFQSAKALMKISNLSLRNYPDNNSSFHLPNDPNRNRPRKENQRTWYCEKLVEL